jgi:hypothetical protein
MGTTEVPQKLNTVFLNINFFLLASNTIIFLLAAGRSRGIERQIINNLTSLHYFRTQYERQ